MDLRIRVVDWTRIYFRMQLLCGFSLPFSAGPESFCSWNEALYMHVANRPLPSSKNPHFQDEARCTTFLVKMSFAWEWKMIFLSKAEQLPSFWDRGPGDLGKWPNNVKKWNNRYYFHKRGAKPRNSKNPSLFFSAFQINAYICITVVFRCCFL